MTTSQPRRIGPISRGFTLTELMVAVVVLLVIILAVGMDKIEPMLQRILRRGK